MRHKLFPNAVIIFIIAVIINFTGCSAFSSDTKQPNKENTLNDKINSVQSNEEKTPETDSRNALGTSMQEIKLSRYIDTKESKYYFINGFFLGSYDNQGWHSLCNTKEGNKNNDSVIFFAKDILNKDAYYIYKNNEFLGESRQLIWGTEGTSGLGCFEDVNAPKEFAKYGKLYHFEGNSSTSDRIFDLPVKLGTELSNLEIPNYCFHTYFVFGENWEPGDDDNALVTNTKSILFPKTLSFAGKPTKEGIEAINLLFKENNMENTEPNFSETIIGNFDNDHKEEILMIANSPTGDNGWPVIIGEGEKDKVGTFSVVLYQDDGNVQTLFKDIYSIKGTVKFTNGVKNLSEIDHGFEYCRHVDLNMIADLNCDGLMEIIITNSLWEMGNAQAYSQNSSGVYDIILRSDWGM